MRGCLFLIFHCLFWTGRRRGTAASTAGEAFKLKAKVKPRAKRRTGRSSNPPKSKWNSENDFLCKLNSGNLEKVLESLLMSCRSAFSPTEGAVGQHVSVQFLGRNDNRVIDFNTSYGVTMNCQPPPPPTEPFCRNQPAHSCL